MTQATQSEALRLRVIDCLKESVSNMRRIAGPVGPLHGFWDTIFEAEQLIEELEGEVSHESV